MIRLFAGLLWLVASFLPMHATAGSFDATLYKDPECGCCAKYVTYLGLAGLRVEAVNTGDVYAVKKKYGVPEALYSCHTMPIGGYVVEGHVPAAALGRLLSEQPDVAGIALPDMPAGSPGMPGPKTEAFTVFSFFADAPPAVFMVE